LTKKLEWIKSGKKNQLTPAIEVNSLMINIIDSFNIFVEFTDTLHINSLNKPSIVFFKNLLSNTDQIKTKDYHILRELKHFRNREDFSLGDPSIQTNTQRSLLFNLPGQ
jgi:hypothetical protein